MIVLRFACFIARQLLLANWFLEGEPPPTQPMPHATPPPGLLLNPPLPLLPTHVFSLSVSSSSYFPPRTIPPPLRYVTHYDKGVGEGWGGAELLGRSRDNWSKHHLGVIVSMYCF